MHSARPGGASRLGSRLASLVMFGAALLYSPLPLLVGSAHDGASLIVIVGLMYVSRIFFLAIAAFVTGVEDTPTSQTSRLSRPLIVFKLWMATRLRYRIMTIVLSMNWILFGIATDLAGPGLAAVLFEIWPAFFVMVTMSSNVVRTDLNASRWSLQDLILMTLAACGVALAILSEDGAWDLGTQASLGVIIGLLSSVVSAMFALAEKRAGETDNLQDVEQWQDWMAGSPIREALVSTSLAGLSRALFGIALVAYAIVVAQASISLHMIILGCASGALAAGANFLFNAGLHLEDKGPTSDGDGPTVRGSGAVTSIYYLVPIFALGWLRLFDRIEVARPDLLTAGAVGVVAVNMIMHLDPEGTRDRGLGASGGHGYRAIVLSLWVCGVIVAFREDWMPDEWVQSSVGEYWGMLGVCATVFVLIMSFRQSRLSERRARMDEMMLRLHSQVLYLGRAGLLRNSTEIGEHLRKIDVAPKPVDISQSYQEARELIIPQVAACSTDDAQRSKSLQDLMIDIDAFTNLRQQGRNFAELAVMTLFAGLTVLLALFVRPLDTELPFVAFVNDAVTMILAAAFVFLVFDLVDKRREADAPLVERVESQNMDTSSESQDTDTPSDDDGEFGWRLALHSVTDPTADRWISSLLGFAVAVIFVSILYFKWLVP